jgi:zeaxanthin glucosyltransferase
MPPSKKILLVTIPERGHINPMLSLAQCLQDLDYSLVFYAASDISDIWKEAGLVGNVYYGGIHLPADFITKGAAFNERLREYEWMLQWIKTLLLDVVEDQVKVIEHIIEKEQPDFILTDPMVYAAVIAANEFQLTWVGVSSSLNPFTPADWTCPLVEMLNSLSDERKALFKNLKYKAAFRISDVLSPWLNLAYSCPSYAPPLMPDPYHVHHLGKSFNRLEANEKSSIHGLNTPLKKVYVSLGSQIYHHPEVFLKISKVCKQNNIRLVAAVNDLLDDASFVESMGEEDVLLRFAPQLEILPNIDLMISHGGANSVMEALSFGKPILLLPHCNDQLLQARFLEHSKAGLVLDPYTANETDYAHAIGDLLAEAASFSSKAKELAIEINNLGGPQRGAELIHDWVQNQMPLLS